MNEPTYGLRGYLAGQALVGRLSNPNFSPTLANVTALATLAVAIADATIDTMSVLPSQPRAGGDDTEGSKDEITSDS